MTIKTGVIGATGYTGIELIRILLDHPSAHLHCVTSDSQTGVKVSDFLPSLEIGQI